jgi:glutaredoxin 3
MRILTLWLDLALEWKVYGRLHTRRMRMTNAAVGIAKRRVEIFSAGCQTCQRTIEQLREQIDPRHEIVVHDMHKDKRAAEKADAFGIRTVPAVVVDGFLLACCKNKGPTLRELHAAGLAKPGQVQLEAS